MGYIENDVFDIAKRLKEVDVTYKLFHNGKTGKFELHGGKSNECIIVFEYDAMDARMLEHARRTRVERADALIKELDEYNERLEKENTKEGVTQLTEAACKLRGMIKGD